MKQFFKFMFASMLGTILSFGAVIILFIVIVAGMASMATATFGDSSKPVTVANNSILKVSFNRPIKERGNPKDVKFNFNDFSGVSPLGLDEIVASLENAKTDDRIKGIYMDLQGIPASMATVEEIRNALIDFKSSGKWIVTYGEILTQGAYYLASVSNEIYLYPMGVVDWKGLSAQSYFIKDMLEKMEVEMQIIRGSNNKFKSAVEPFMLDHMSDANKEQTAKYVGSIWDHLVEGVSAARGVDVATLNQLADSLSIQKAGDAIDAKLIDGALYPDEISELLKTKLGLSENDDVNFVSLKKYRKVKPKTEAKNGVASYKKPKVAVIYAVGSIASGKGGDGVMGSETISKAIQKARLDTAVKAIVLRVNSPGGSALASDVMWREVMLAKEVKPFVVSMGDVAASGGYYISCAAHRIFAHENTITGSIGVFGMLPNAKGLFNNKLGIQFDGIKTNAHADLGDLARPLDNYEFRVIQNGVDLIYEDFITKVANGRSMTTAEVDNIGQGRVWSGKDAIENGLVDEFGGLNDAIDHAAELAGMEDYRLMKLPTLKDPLEELIMELSDVSAQSVMSWVVGDDIPFLQEWSFIKKLKKQDQIQARIPYVLDIY